MLVVSLTVRGAQSGRPRCAVLACPTAAAAADNTQSSQLLPLNCTGRLSALQTIPVSPDCRNITTSQARSDQLQSRTAAEKRKVSADSGLT